MASGTLFVTLYVFAAFTVSPFKFVGFDLSGYTIVTQKPTWFGIFRENL